MREREGRMKEKIEREIEGRYGREIDSNIEKKCSLYFSVNSIN